MSVEVDEVIIILDGGLVRDVFAWKDNNRVSIPATVHDYDIEGIDPDETPVLTDAEGSEYIEWGI